MKKNDELFELIKDLVETPGPSGSEQAIQKKIRSIAEPYADEIRSDALGNLIVRKGSKKAGGMRIMLSAHVDEIGLMVTHVDDNGFARFHAIGSVHAMNCMGGRVLFTNGQQGVIGCDRLMPNTLPTLENLYIDTGASSKEDCQVQVGDVAGFTRPTITLGERIVAKSMDDRIAAVVLIEALKALKSSPNEIFFVFSTQEEVGLRGATVAAFGIDPEIGLAVDVTGTGDTPRARKMNVSLGKGAAIKVKDASFIAHPGVVNWMIAQAKASKIPYQMEVMEFGGTDGRAIQLTRAGVPAGCLSIPCRYIHTPSEMVDRGDVEACINLLTALLSHKIDLGLALE